MNQNWIGDQIAMLRKKKGYTGDKLSEILGVTPQAVSKWENGKCLPDTSILIKLAQSLEVTIDQLLIERELTIIEAVFTDGVNFTDVTSILNQYMIRDHLNLYITVESLGIKLKSERIGLILIQYQLSSEVFYTFAPENTFLTLNKDTKGIQYVGNGELEVVAAYFGQKDNYRDCFAKIIHYNFFQWKEIYVDTEVFPSSPSIDNKEYLTIVYINCKGIHAISAAEKETLIYQRGRTEFGIKDKSSGILPGIRKLGFEQGMDCTWAGAMTLALENIGESYSYEQIMGLSGACYRIAFYDRWDWSATDALVAYDYSRILFDAIGYEVTWANRLEKTERKKERERIVTDILHNKPILAINLREAPEWGVITGYADGGKRLYCRTYFDGEYQNEQEEYLESEFWPFLIQHFGEKKEERTLKQKLRASLQAMVDSFEAPLERGYYQGSEGYEHWIAGLKKDELWNEQSQVDDTERRLEVNDAILLNLTDARRCAGVYLKECVSLLPEEDAVRLDDIAVSYHSISERVSRFREKLKEGMGKVLCYNGSHKTKMNTGLRGEQVLLLQEIKKEEKRLVENAKYLLDRIETELLK